MAYQKLQVGRATDMDDKQSDTEDTVNLNNVINTYTRTSGGTGGVTNDANATFISDGVKIGDLVFLPNSTNPAFRIIAVNSETQIVCSAPVAAVGDDFTILSQSEEPAVLYVGTAAAGATLKVRTAGGDDATFVNIPQGSFIPVQVKRVYDTGTTASDILALF
jgi:hypothetical protein